MLAESAEQSSELQNLPLGGRRWHGFRSKVTAESAMGPV